MRGAICLQTPTVFWLGGGTFFALLLNENGVNDVREAVHTAESLVPEPRAFEVEMAIKKLKRHKSPGIDQIPAEFLKAGSGTVCPEIHKKTKLRGFSPRANHTDRAAAAGRRS